MADAARRAEFTMASQIFMPEDAKDRGHRDRDRIDISHEQECRYWGDKLGVSSDKIKDAVKQVGPRAKDVEHHLRDDAEVSRSA
jgi:hypothetical protein